MKIVFLLSAAIAFAQSPATFTATGNMITARSGHTATLLLSGKLLIAGGMTSSTELTPSAELFDPPTGSFVPTGNMIQSRRLHTATLLPDGTVLIAGGFAGTANSPTPSAELYDPSGGTFKAIGDVSRTTSHAVHTATLLSNGKVLLAGIGPRAELYDPVAGTFSDTGPYANPSLWLAATAALLSDGRVLITGCTVGCGSGVTQLYNPDTNTFSATGGVKPGCSGNSCWFQNVNTATSLTNGKVLIVGSSEYVEPADAEVYDPSTGIFSSIGNTTAPHEFCTAMLLPDGAVLIAGSQLAGGSGDPSVEIYDPRSSRFSFAGHMTTPRHSHTATLLPDGTVLIAGGNDTWPLPTSTAELYSPAVLTPSPVLYSLAGGLQGAIWHATTGEVASPGSPAVAGEILSMYTSNLIEGAVIRPKVAIGGRLVEVLFFGDAPGYAGYSQLNFRVPPGVAPSPGVFGAVDVSRPFQQCSHDRGAVIYRDCGPVAHPA
jgi:hypothetical protein